MRKVKIEEGSWVLVLDSSGKPRIGKIDRTYESEPFSEKNMAVYLKGEGTLTIRLQDIIKVYPKVEMKERQINPSKRNENESK